MTKNKMIELIRFHLGYADNLAEILEFGEDAVDMANVIESIHMAIDALAKLEGYHEPDA